MATVSITHTTARLQSAGLSLAIDAAYGGRITTFSMNGSNALCTSGVQTGSTFWPSPQSSWGWPPPPVLDSGRYKLELESVDRSPVISLTSDVCPITELRVAKQVGELLPGRAVWVQYTLENCSGQARQVAPWEITRAPGGLSFYQSGQPQLPLSQGNIALDQAQGCNWYRYEPKALQQPSKIFAADSNGWLANANPESRLLLLKRFAAIPATEAAPGEAELEIYAHNELASPYIELEQQGAYRLLPSGGRTTWTVYWSLMHLPADVSVDVGSQALLQRVRQQLVELPEPVSAPAVGSGVSQEA